MTRKSKASIVLAAITALVLIVALLYYNFVFQRHIFVATISEIRDTRVTFETKNNSFVSAEAPEIIIPLLKEGDEYMVVVYSNLLRSSFIKDIKSLEDQGE